MKIRLKSLGYCRQKANYAKQTQLVPSKTIQSEKQVDHDHGKTDSDEDIENLVKRMTNDPEFKRGAEKPKQEKEKIKADKVKVMY